MRRTLGRWFGLGRARPTPPAATWGPPDRGAAARGLAAGPARVLGRGGLAVLLVACAAPTSPPGGAPGAPERLYVADALGDTVAPLNGTTGRAAGPPLPAGPLPDRGAPGPGGGLLVLSAADARAGAGTPLTRRGGPGPVRGAPLARLAPPPHAVPARPRPPGRDPPGGRTRRGARERGGTDPGRPGLIPLTVPEVRRLLLALAESGARRVGARRRPAG